MKKVFFLCAFIVLMLVVYADHYPIKRQFGNPQQIDGHLPIAIKEFQGTWGDVDAAYFFNTSGGSLSVGDVVIWDNSIVAVVDTYDASGAGSGTYDTCTIADSIKHYSWHEIYAYFSNPSNDSLIIIGTDSANATQTDTIVKASTAGDVWSTYKWRKVDLAYAINSNANIGVNFIPYGGVKKTTSTGSKWVAGVVGEERGADSLVKIVISGITDVKVAGATTAIKPGYPLCIGATSGYATVATVLHSPFGVALESGNTNTTYLSYVNPVGLMDDTLGRIASDQTFTIHVNAFDFLYAASGVTYIPAEGCVHPTAAAEAIYAPITIPYSMYGATIVVDTIMAFFNTDASGDDFDFALIRSDHDGSLTTDVNKDDIGNGGTGADSLALITTDVTLGKFPYHIECDVNNAGAATDVKIYGFRLDCHTE
jgi:hypothetical protein